MTDLDPVVAVALGWVAFGGSHLGLAAMHDRGVARLGELPFMVAYWLVASVTFVGLCAAYAANRHEGPPGLALAAVPAARGLLEGVAFAGIVLVWTGLAAYPRLPTALFGQPVVAPRGIERITRHPTFAGFAVWGLAHALLATRLVGTLWFGGFVLLAAAGAWHQDRRRLAARGAPYAEYLAATSFVPFARGLPAWRDLPVGPLLGGIGVAALLRAGHAHLLAHGGVWVAAAVVVGGTAAAALAWRRSRALP